MILQITIALCILIPLGSEFSPSDNSIKELLLGLIGQFCPESDVCPEYVQHSVVPVTPGFSSCCKGCSCSADCKTRNDCCFPLSDSTVQNSITEYSMDTISRCLWPMTIKPTDPTKSYRMITNMSTNDTTPCGEVSVANWGSMYPVYSNTTKLIYKNSACAEADGVTDGVTWTPIIYCEMFYKVNNVYTRARQFMFGFEKNNFPRNCYVYFEYPGDQKDLATRVCYNDVVDSCPNADFNMPDSLMINASKQMIREACSSGLFSPFYGAVIYANVFCFVCHNNYYQTNFKCANEKYRLSADGFVGLLSQDDTSKIADKTSSVRHHLQNVCPESGNVNVTCRSLYCPAGQLRMPNGNCTLLFKYWFITPICVHLTLTSTVGFNISKVLPASEEEFTSLTNTWSYPWKVVSVSIERLATETTSNISVILQNDMPSTNPYNILKSITSNVEKPWFLYMGSLKENVTLKSTFSKYLTTSPQQKDISIINGSHQLITRFYNTYTVRNRKRPALFYIDKLFTCDQVELLSSEFDIYFDNLVLYNKIAGKYLFDGEFVITEAQDGLRARICLEGSGFMKDTNKGCTVAKPGTIIGCFLFGFYLLFCIKV